MPCSTARKDSADAAADVLRTWPFFRVNQFVTNYQDETDRSLIAEDLHNAGLK